MRHIRRFIVVITGVAAWCLAATTTAYAKVPDPIYDRVPSVSTPTLAGTPLWQVLAYWSLGILLVIAVVGLGYALSHAPRSEPSTRLRA
ncbi:MAG: hypothetical protein ABI903_14475 [Actinomycetota bacterium]